MKSCSLILYFIDFCGPRIGKISVEKTTDLVGMDFLLTVYHYFVPYRYVIIKICTYFTVYPCVEIVTLTLVPNLSSMCAPYRYWEHFTKILSYDIMLKSLGIEHLKTSFYIGIIGVCREIVWLKSIKYGCSWEPPHGDGSDEHPQSHSMF